METLLDQTLTIPFDDDDSPPPEHREGWLLVRIHVPELNVSKCLQFPTERLVWDVKQQVLASLPKDLKESFNYGLFCPPSNGKAGKFLDEERRLGDYPFSGPVGYLELKYKRRVYKMLNLDEKQLKALHTRANLRRLLEYVNNGQVEKVSKMCAKGLDPNFHCQETNETPLTIAVGVKKPNKLLIALVNGGAILDYRAKDGSTALHRAVEKNSLESVSTLLELGASPNYRDMRGITPLYLSVTKKADPKISEALLHDHATLGVQDSQGWQEIHQACRNGLVHHLEHLLFYSADMNARNASGNTPLHVCAVNNQEACARMLLFRGAQRGSLNYANQTPYQVAVIAGNLELAEMIQNYKPEDIVPFRGPPRYNPRRRSALGWPSGIVGGHCGVGLGGGHLITSSATMIDLRTLTRLGMVGPPSPCPSEQPFSSASSSLSEGSSHRSHEDDISIVTDKSLGDTSDIISDSSGVGTASSDSTACSIGHPNLTVVCMIPYTKNYPGHLNIQPGDVIEVFGSTDCGLMEGQVRGSNRTGLFPVQYVQEVNFRQKNITSVSTAPSQQQQHIYLEEMVGGGDVQLMQSEQKNDYNMLNNNNDNANINHLNSAFQNNNSNGGGGQSYSSLTAPRIKRMNFNEPRSVTLHRAKRGFGFVLRGAKATSPLMQLKPSDRCPALQYLDDVDPGGVADLAGLKPGDYLLAINNTDVRAASHEQVVDLIRKSGALVSLTVLSAPNFAAGDANGNNLMYQSSGNGSNGNVYAAPASSQFATLPRRIMQNGKMPAPAPPQRDPKTTLSVGRARAKSMVAGLESEDRDENDVSTATITTNKSSSAESLQNQSQSNTPQCGGTPVQLRTASIKARPTSSRITAAELEEMFQRQQGAAATDRYSSMMTTSNFRTGGGGDSGSVTPHASPQKAPLVYSSVADMKRRKAKGNGGGTGTLRGKPCEIPTVNGDSNMRRNFHSTPDLTLAMAQSGGWLPTFRNQSSSNSQEEMNRYRGSMQRLNLPPPNHPPPPAPIEQGHLVKVEVASEYECTATLRKTRKDPASSDVMSSFKPSSNAKLYACPQDIRTVAFRAKVEKDKTRRKTTQVTPESLGRGISDYAQPSQVISPQQQQPQMTMPQAQETVNSAAVPQQSPPPPPPPPPLPEQPAPPIPDPDYSLSESEDAEEDKKKMKEEVKVPANPPPPPAPLPSAGMGGLNSNGNLANSIAAAAAALQKVPQKKVEPEKPQQTNGANGVFSVSEIQKMRNNLKSSKSYPHDLKEKVEEVEVEEKSVVGQVEEKKNEAPAEEVKKDCGGVKPAAQVFKTENSSPPVTVAEKKPESQLINPLAKKSVNFVDLKPVKSSPSTVPVAQTSPLPVFKTPVETKPVSANNHHHHQQIYQSPSPVAYVKKEERTVASLMGDTGTDDDDEIGLDELDDEYLNAADSPSPPPMEFQRHNSMTRKQATSLAMQRAMQIQQKGNGGGASIVSLAQLPPPMENCLVESDLEVLANAAPGVKQAVQANSVKHYHVHQQHVVHSQAVGGHHHYTNRQHNNPIQVQFHTPAGAAVPMMARAMPASSPTTENLVLAPPPQFSDESSPAMGGGGGHHHYHVGGKLGQNVRIVGAVPKSSNRF